MLAVYKIRVGDKIFMWYFGANRDEPVIGDPDRFCINREIPCKHLSFGAEINRCLVDRLVNLLLSILLEDILKRDLDNEAHGPPERIKSNFIRGIKKLLVRIAALRQNLFDEGAPSAQLSLYG